MKNAKKLVALLLSLALVLSLGAAAATAKAPPPAKPLPPAQRRKAALLRNPVMRARLKPPKPASSSCPSWTSPPPFLTLWRMTRMRPS